MVNVKHVRVRVPVAMGSMWMGAVDGMQGGMRRERVERVSLNRAWVQVVLMGMANTNMTGLIHLGTTVATGSHGELMKVGWTKMGP